MRLLLPLLLLALPALAGEEDFSQYGTTNPEEMTLERLVERAARGDVDMIVCANGYLATKSGRHEAARIIFEACAAAGWTQAMNWMSQLDHNGLGADEDPDRATEWSRRAGQMGDAVGKYNHGIDMIRGRGVAQDVEAGRALVDQAAAAGLGIARRLQSADYDLDEVTPDADAWKYAPMF
ncbi:MAG: sel1 repeat family protein [Rhodobacteraceae bacterium]|nr:sel1 repeat family protein [Paracoccaceae bacterium]MCC6009234.1 sel1 repeat family protein [Paracoccaceae bacterium]